MSKRIYLGWANGVLLLTFAVLFLFQLPVASAASAPGFEVPGIQNVSDILPRELISGPHYRVREKVVSYGYMHHFTVDSDYGVFEVTGDFALRKLVKEIGAIAVLHEVKRGQAYINGVRKAASKPLEFGVNLITEPADTISGVPKGVAALFENVKTGLSTQRGKNEDRKVEQMVAVSSNKRLLARQLGIDVYSSNKVLQKELNSVAWATSLGSLTVSAALAPVGGPAVAAVSLTRTAQNLTDMINEYPPQRLRQTNQEKLEAMGITHDLATRFLDFPSFTPTQQTVIVGSLETFSKARGLDSFLRYALSADSEESADFFMYIAEMMKGYNLKVSPIQEVSVYGPLVFARASNGSVIIPLPLDRAIWTERSSQRVPEAILSHKAMNPGLKKYELWFTGTTTKVVKERAKKQGLQIVENVASQFEFTY
ncbi:MAG: hypothetical protein AB9866_26600 [Syntrophobacteraceae bacterium]